MCCFSHNFSSRSPYKHSDKSLRTICSEWTRKFENSGAVHHEAYWYPVCVESLETRIFVRFSFFDLEKRILIIVRSTISERYERIQISAFYARRAKPRVLDKINYVSLDHLIEFSTLNFLLAEENRFFFSPPNAIPPTVPSVSFEIQRNYCYYYAIKILLILSRTWIPAARLYVRCTAKRRRSF